MLVIISDLHLTDGTSGATISPGAFHIFAERLVDLAVNASWRSDGSYKPIDRIDIVLLGDVLDLIRSARWAQHNELRPWSHPQRPEFLDLITRITNDVLRHNDDAFGVLRSLALQGDISLPPADRQGRPVAAAEGLPVAVRIWYMVGNHDWFLHLAGPSYDLMRQSIVRHLGLANRADHPFPHDAAENDELSDVFRRHRVYARHGDMYDPFNFEGDRDASSLGDAIVVELLSRFATAVESEMAADLPTATLLGLRELDNIRPLLLIPVWIDGLLERTCPVPAQRRHVKQIWDKLADRFLDLPFVRQRDTWNPADLVDGLQSALKFSRRVSVGWASSIITWLNELRVPSEGTFFRYALAEQEFRNRRAKHIVYGHTHTAESVPLDASYADGYALQQVYFNSGTWRRVYRQAQFAPNEHEFVASDVMTYIAFFQADERGGRPFESWSGNLGLAPSDEPLLRLDPAPIRHAPGQPLSASALHGRAPHFNLAPADAPAGIIPTRRVGRVSS
ncbi:MAG: hypothetical protein K1X74_00925 [Pirellulales bacterium]|nr:hypothetical protein [Pirellulales bacterium]